ncbi:hypothetical protein FA95DRAFT_1511300 [Auriscalpium vulgare]|uniref:Uncharacterized protein n=1 Tax=Auriscalpium vulgare TaxID=40419 RepID=A0ACB8S7L3_9AGAM|nr:hypothetical protein FA95DRAFT_1511300 [Auriscalpium vulgare]
MGRGILYWIFQRPKFCCCFPVRACVTIMSLLGLVFASFLSIIIWYEVATTPTLSQTERTSFIAAGVVESLLAVISAVGFIGVVVRKQTFVTTYAIALYVHFAINLGVAGYFLYVILHATHTDSVAACHRAITDKDAQKQCDGLLDVIRWLYALLASLLLVFELYGAIVATRYFFQLRTEKRTARLPAHERGTSDANASLIPGFVRYKDANGDVVYDSYYYPPSSAEGKGHARGASQYSLHGDDEEAGALYDPPRDLQRNEQLYDPAPVRELGAPHVEVIGQRGLGEEVDEPFNVPHASHSGEATPRREPTPPKSDLLHDADAAPVSLR